MLEIVPDKFFHDIAPFNPLCVANNPVRFCNQVFYRAPGPRVFRFYIHSALVNLLGFFVAALNLKITSLFHKQHNLVVVAHIIGNDLAQIFRNRFFEFLSALNNAINGVLAGRLVQQSKTVI